MLLLGENLISPVLVIFVFLDQLKDGALCCEMSFLRSCRLMKVNQNTANRDEAKTVSGMEMLFCPCTALAQSEISRQLAFT